MVWNVRCAFSALVLIVVVGLQFEATNAYRLGRRQSGFNFQLHKERRENDIEANRLLLIYQLKNIQENANLMKPVQILSPQPETEEIRQIIRTVNHPSETLPDEQISATLSNSSSNASESNSPNDDDVGKIAKEQYPVLIVELNTKGTSRTTNRRKFNGKLHNGRNGPLILVGNGLQARIENAGGVPPQLTASVLQKVKQLCLGVNKRIRNVTPGVMVRRCKLN